MPAAAQFLPTHSTLASDRGVELSVSECRSCGMVQLLGEPVPYFREVLRAAAVSPEMRAFRLDQFRAFATEHGLSGRHVLEVGCGCGDYLAVLQEAGMIAAGLEYSAKSVESCRASGLTALCGFVDGPDYKIPDGPYDGFFILNFLEHLPEPRQALLGIAGNLRPGGVGLVEVPNFEMIIRERLFAEFIGDHLLYFTRDTLCRALGLSGFEVLDCKSVWHDYILSATVRKRGPIDFASIDARRVTLGRDVSAFLDRFPARHVAIWGAGHQALALINLLGLNERVRYVVDSAPFKQNCFTPGSHLRIVAPQALRDDPVGAVLVMAGSYSTEISAILRRDYDPALDIAILSSDGLQA